MGKENPVIETIASVTWGMMSDEYTWPANWAWDIINVDIRKNSREVKQSWAFSNGWNTASWKPMAFYPGNTYLTFTHNWYIDGLFWPQVYKNKSSTSWSNNYRNYVKFWNKDLILAPKYIHQAVLDMNAYTTWFWLRGSNLLPSWYFSSNWTLWAWWALNGGSAQHTNWGWTATLIPTVAVSPSVWWYYRTFISQYWCTTGSCVITFAWTTVGTINSSSAQRLYFWTSYVGAWDFTFTPSNDFNGSIQQVTLYAAQNMTEQQWTFTNNVDSKPFLVFHNMLMIWDGNLISTLTYTGWTFTPVSWALPTKITLDPTETVLWLFELWDQVVFFTDKAQYFRDWWNVEYDRRVPRDEPIVGVAQYKTTFYVATRSTANTMLWKTSSGYDRVQVFKDEAYFSWPARRFRVWNSSWNYNSMIVANGLMYLLWESYPLNGEIFVFWAFNPWMSEPFSRLCCSDTSGYATAIWSAWYGMLNIGMCTGSTYGRAVIETQRDYSNVWYSRYPWTIMFKPTIWTLESVIKEAQKIRVWYKFTSTYNRILIHARTDDETNRVSFYIPRNAVTTVPAVWDTYTGSGNTLTITAIWADSNNNYYMTGSFTWTNLFGITWTLTRATGSWDVSVIYSRQYPVKTIGMISWDNAEDYANKRFSMMYNQKFYKLQLWVTLHSINSNYTSKFYDIALEYNNIQNDL